MIRRLLILSALLTTLAAPAIAGADRKPLVLGASGQQQQIQAADTLATPALKVTGQTGSTQCAQFDSAGALTGTGSTCGGSGGTPGGSSGQVQYNNAGAFGGFTFGGDCTLSVPNLTCTKTGGTSFGYFATGTDASNLTGTLGLARFGSQSANQVLAGPSSGSAATPSWRALVGADLPNPGASSLGGVESIASASHKWLNAISTSGVPSQTQPACGDLSDAAASCSTDATNAANITSGVLGSSRGGAGAVSGILKANGSGVVSAAASSTDYAPATSGSAILAGNGSGGFSSISVGSGLNLSGGTLTATGVVTPLATTLSVFGSGADGNLASSFGTVTLTRDMFYNNVTCGASDKIITSGWRLFIAGTLDISNASAGCIQWNGSTNGTNGSSPGAGAGSSQLSRNSVGGSSPSGGGGGLGSTTNGAQAAAVTASAAFNDGGPAGQGGAGGVGSGGTGGAARLAVAATGYVLDRVTQELSFWGSGGALAQFNGGVPAPGGGGGGGTGGNNSGGGGGGGAGGGVVYLAANTVARGASTTACAIESLGGTGTNGGTPANTGAAGGGGGGGGGGGYLYLVINSLTGSTATNAICTDGGAAGNGGNGVGAGLGGQGGAGGGGGPINLFNLTAGTQTLTPATAANSAPSLPVTTTGSTGTSGVTNRVSL